MLAYTLLTIAQIVGAGNIVAGRLAPGEISPMLLTGLRWGIAAVVLCVVGRRQLMTALPVLRTRWRSMLWMGATGSAVFSALFYAAASHTTGVNLAILQGCLPAFVLVGAFLVHKTRVSPLQACGVALTLVGVAVVATKGSLGGIGLLQLNLGDLLTLIACVVFTAYVVELPRRPAIPQIAFFAAIAIVASVLSVPLVALEAATGNFVWPSAQGWAVALYAAVFPTLVGQVMFMRGVEMIGPGRAGLFINLIPVFGSFGAVLVLGEPFGAYQALALALVFAGIGLAEVRRPGRGGPGRRGVSGSRPG